MTPLERAIHAAGTELVEKHGWGMCDDPRTPMLETMFGRVVMKHVAPLLSPEARAVRIAALLAELAVLEAGND
jgi:hypothetical protein